MDNNAAEILFVGDILLHSDYNRTAREKGPDFVFEKVSAAFKDADLRFGNLETVLSRKGAPIYGKGCLAGDESYIGALKNAGFDLFSLSNNHTFDFGPAAYEEMSLNLRKAGIKTVGAGADLEASRKMLAMRVKDLRLGFLAYSSRLNKGRNYATDTDSGVAPLDEGYVLEDVTRYKNDVDHLVVSLHWGIEHSPYPTPDQISLAHKIIDNGAKIVIGHHPQILQGIERYGDGVIMYSLGNFCHLDYYWEGPQRTYQFKIKAVDREAVVARVRLSRRGIEGVDITPLCINESGQPEICEGERSAAILKKLDERSEAVKKADFEKYWNEMIIKKRVGNPVRIWWEKGNLLYKIKNFKYSQIKTLFDLFLMFVEVRFSRTNSKWQMLNPRNDEKPRPFCGKDEEVN